MTKRDLVVAITGHHHARLLKYYPRRPCTPSFVKSRMLRPLQTHFLLFQQTFFVLVCIHPGTPRVPPRVLASGMGQNPAGAITRSNEKKQELSRKRRLGWRRYEEKILLPIQENSLEQLQRPFYNRYEKLQLSKLGENRWLILK